MEHGFMAYLKTILLPFTTSIKQVIYMLLKINFKRPVITILTLKTKDMCELNFTYYII